ncbi:GNAT family N-acetyltransferase [Microcoleus sp. FACHB-672]|uniref:GNAT family N-acetyltransferase n=1 Tax=Microcoleus sp. FACHB-672 TaxID=2692825 RepID=UPI0016820EAC|nr:GNAT family N-acetyltransferase [Microcoleus sp. FACHB-672]MBD2043392.1 GNAT family N-acetyltransferase [Microcoleus sp. FACHB-672]
MNSYRIVSELNEQQVSELTELYAHEVWSQNRSREDVVKMLAASDVVIGLIDDSDHLIAFIRVLTDFVYRAFIYDVIVKSSHRNQGVGKKLMDSVVEHPQLQTVERLGLSCLPEMIPFYERWGFTSEVGGVQLMARINQNPAR